MVYSLTCLYAYGIEGLTATPRTADYAAAVTAAVPNKTHCHHCHYRLAAANQWHVAAPPLSLPLALPLALAFQIGDVCLSTMER